MNHSLDKKYSPNLSHLAHFILRIYAKCMLKGTHFGKSLKLSTFKKRRLLQDLYNADDKDDDALDDAIVEDMDIKGSQHRTLTL